MHACSQNGSVFEIKSEPARKGRCCRCACIFDTVLFNLIDSRSDWHKTHSLEMEKQEIKAALVG